MGQRERAPMPTSKNKTASARCATAGVLPPDVTHESEACRMRQHRHHQRAACCAAVLRSLLVFVTTDSKPLTVARGKVNADTLLDYVRSPHARAMGLQRVGFGVAAYDNKIGSWEQALPQPPSNPGGSLLLHLSNGSIKSTRYRPKQIYQLQQVPTLIRRYRYEAVWLLDSDIELQETNLTALLHTWLCGFPGGPPFVSQPTIRPGKQQVWALNDDQWWPLNQSRRPRAVSLPYVEIQAPLFLSDFYLWWMQRQGLMLAPMQDFLSTAWGGDYCEGAIAYARYLAARARRGKAGASACTQACAVLLSPVNHANTKTIGDHGTERESRAKGKLLLDWLNGEMMRVLPAAGAGMFDDEDELSEERSVAWPRINSRPFWDLATTGYIGRFLNVSANRKERELYHSTRFCLLRGAVWKDPSRCR